MTDNLAELAEFAESFQQEVLSRSNDEESGHFREDKFTEVMIEYLTEANEVDQGEICYYKSSTSGEKLNAFNSSADNECVDLFISLYSASVPPVAVPQSDVRTHFRWLRRFFAAALDGKLRNLEESSLVFEVAQQIYAGRDDITKARLFFLTDGVVRSTEVDRVEIPGVEVEYHVWDLEKLRRFITSRMQRECIEIDFERDFGGSVPCLEAPASTNEYRTFLAFFPGTLLSQLYGEYGPRLLERNVRSFLQAKGKINKGIRATVLNEPSRFLAYNNGISATAQAVELTDNGAKNGVVLRRARDFQIVNGGQTTASIYHVVRKEHADIEKLVVQVKLTVLNDPANMQEFVPLISKYANSQNKVNAADFSANHPFHVKLEELSRRLWAPAATGTDRQTHWYYERARGSYLDDKIRQGTPSKMRAFESINPLRQKFTKTDLAKYENSWNQYPHLVSSGAEKNFIKFSAMLSDAGYPVVDEQYFQRLVAKAILFKATEKLVGAQEYGGFRAQIVTYTIAWLSHATAQRIDLTAIWNHQVISEALAQAVVRVSDAAYRLIVEPPANRRNPSEWSKREECWQVFRSTDIGLPMSLGSELLDTSRPTSVIRDRPVAVDSPTPGDAVLEIRRVMDVPADTWFGISRWAKETNNLQPWQRSLAFSLGRLARNNRAPSAKQAIQGVKILDESTRRGFDAGAT